MSSEKEKSITEMAQAKINEWKGTVEHLNMQLHLGATEAKVEFENQKKNLNAWIHTVEEKLHESKAVSEERAQKLKQSIEELQVQAALGKAETEEALLEQHDRINKAMHQLKRDLADAYGSTETRAKEISEEAQERLDDYHTKFDLYRMRAKLAQMEADDVWNEKRKELTEKLNVLNTKLEKNLEVTSDKWDNFSEEMTEAWKHLRSAFKG